MRCTSLFTCMSFRIVSGFSLLFQSVLCLRSHSTCNKSGLIDEFAAGAETLLLAVFSCRRSDRAGCTQTDVALTTVSRCTAQRNC